MKLLRLNALSPNFQLPQTAVTIGNFDGVHLGHQAMIAQLKKIAAAQNFNRYLYFLAPHPNCAQRELQWRQYKNSK